MFPSVILARIKTRISVDINVGPTLMSIEAYFVYGTFSMVPNVTIPRCGHLLETLIF